MQSHFTVYAIVAVVITILSATEKVNASLVISDGSLVNFTYSSIMDLSSIGENPSAEVNVEFSYVTGVVPEKVGSTYSRYFITGLFAIDSEIVTFTDALVIVSNDNLSIGGDSFSVTNHTTYTTIDGELSGLDVTGFSFGIRDSTYSAFTNTEIPEDPQIFDDFDTNRDALRFNSFPLIVSLDTPFSVSASIVPEPSTALLFAFWTCSAALFRSPKCRTRRSTGSA